MHLNVNEVFGPTIQGEGPFTGQRVAFLRLAGCNLSCSWCDTPYSWDWERYDKNEESHKRVVSDLAEELSLMPVTTLVISGGEPMLQQKGIGALKEHLAGWSFHIETNGTIAPLHRTDEAVTHYTVSPKLAHAGDPEDARIKPTALEAFAQRAWDGKAIFKFVAETHADLETISVLVRTHHIPNEAVWVMPEGATRERHMQTLSTLADSVIAKGWNLSSRLHVLVWDAKRGV